MFYSYTAVGFLWSAKNALDIVGDYKELKENYEKRL